ncbi:MAG: serine/threonine protein kinase [Planctomycetaceae bacterium]|nr:serine/threonine protein kinase [Planctomycetaceae bacterium]
MSDNPQNDATLLMQTPTSEAARHRGMRMLAGSESDVSAHMSQLLADRLRNMVLVFFVGLSAFLVPRLVVREASSSPWMAASLACHVLVTLGLAVIGWRLCVRCKFVAGHLRLVESIVVMMLAAQFLLSGVSEQLQTAEHGLMLNPIPAWLLLIFVYALYVPNTWRRAAMTIGGMTLLAESTLWLPRLIDPHTQELLHRSATAEMMLVRESVGLLFCAGVAIWGVRMIGNLRRRAQEAEQIGQYRLKRLLGRGGMGEVHLAEHVLLRRPCAIKLIKPEQSGNVEALERFEKEVRSTARLTHWNTIEIFDYGQSDDGAFYYVMEYLPGLNLQQIVEMNGPLPPERVIHLLMQVCDALAEAHDRGLVHRDIKPANIFAASRGGVFDVAKLLDFGLVREHGGTTDDAGLTRQGLITGSPLFISPEQVLGEPPDSRSDLYSLGVVGYYLLTGHVPFESSKAIEVLMGHAREEPTPIESHGIAIPQDLAQIVMRCLEKTPAARYGSALELQVALRHCELSGVWTREKAALWWEASGCPNKRALDAEVMGLADRAET